MTAHSLHHAELQAVEPERPATTKKLTLSLRVNDENYRLNVEPRRTLLDALRLDCGLTGTKKVCETGNCGACTVHLDGEAVYSCLVLAAECETHSITTIEGLDTGGQISSLQQAFIDCDALQCGYCTPGQIMSLKALFDRVRYPTEEEIVETIAGNLCRCGAYRNILRAARAVVTARRNRDGRAAILND